MMPFKRTFESEKHQLQELNSRLFQYLSRTKQLEQENVHLITEINKLRQAKTTELEPKCKGEMRELRRMVEQLSFEKSQAEMEREKLWRELQMVQSLCSEQTGVCRDISGELKGCEKELQHAHKINVELQQRLCQLENESKGVEEVQRKEKVHLRRQVDSRMVPIITQTYRGPPAATMEEVQEYARSLSEGWMETFDMYQRKVEEMEQSIKEDQERMSGLQREKMMYASELDKLRREGEKQGKIQFHLEEELMHMQEKFRVDFSEYQMIIEQLEHERNLMAETIAEKMRDHQNLLQVRMDLGMEVASYRALLEGERMDLQDTHRRVTQQQRERIIDIRMPALPYTQRASPQPADNIQIPARARHQSPASRRDMISFTKSRASTPATTTTSVTKDKPTSQSEYQIKQHVQKTEAEENTDEIKKMEDQASHKTSSSTDTRSVRVVSPQMMSLSKKLRQKTKSKYEIIEKAMRPEGLEARVSSPGESKVTYHVEKTEQEDGTTKTQIVLESKVEEELDLSEDSVLEDLLSQGVMKVSLEDIKDTATGSMIQNLLSGLQASGNLENKSINVEIIEEPVESYNDEDLEFESRSTFYEPSSTYFQIEELENIPHEAQVQRSDREEVTDHFKGGFDVREVSRQSESSYFSHEEPDEYFVSTPDDNLSEIDDGGGITSYGHYGMVDDLSDERYYQDEGLPSKRVIAEGSDEYKFMSDDHSFVKDSLPECIIEEEVCVSPVVQESMLEFLREDSLEPREQLKGALEKLQSSVSGPLKEELAFLSKVNSDGSQNVEVKKVTQSSDNGNMTIVAELNVSQSLEDSGLLEAEGDMSEEQIMAVLRSSNPGLENAFQEGAGGGYSFRVSKEEDVVTGEEFEGFTSEGGFSSEVTEKHIKLGPSEKSFTFQMDVEGSHAEATSEQELLSQAVHSPVKISHQKRVATVYLERPTDD
ncbi:Synemin [Dissostichus eleginoides]|uniref:Synemin n=1 Tax=Dissostichus eleginoides TaxID=100907 RepID=A0AAD9F3R8_DISEL|nr:Synemin [Dissostichus eleginoides]